MSPRIAYWTSAFDSHMEAVAGEVALLRRQYPRSITWGMHARHWLMLSRQRGFCIHPRLHPLFRGATRLLQGCFDLHHIVGSLGDWYYLEGPRRRPTVLTMATMGTTVEHALLDRVDRFVVEHPGGKKELTNLGINADRIRLVFPPVDLEKFTPAPPADGPFTVLFASSPDESDWLAARGVPQLLDAATLRPAMRFRFLWRPWGNSLAVVKQWVADRGLQNVEIVAGVCTDMPAEYRRAHVTAAPFTDMTRAKPAPDSVVESLACGRPVLVSDAVGLAEVIAQEHAGRVAPVTGAALAEQLDCLQAEWSQHAVHARAVAERHFSAKAFLDGYERVYSELLWQ